MLKVIEQNVKEFSLSSIVTLSIIIRLPEELEQFKFKVRFSHLTTQFPMKNFASNFDHHDAIILMRSINQGDLESMRLWKNQHKSSFFNKQDISPEQQENWYNEYVKRPHDYMFIILVDSNHIGCMGIRLTENSWDAYNIMIGNSQYRGTGIMSICFKKMLYFAASIAPIEIGLKVLKKNPAVDWYIKQGLTIKNEQEEYFELTLTNKIL